MLQNLYNAIVLATLLLLLSSQQQEVNATFSPTDQDLVIMFTSQYHFVPLGSFFQYSLASWEEGKDSKYIDKVAVSYCFQMLSPNPRYNFLVLYSDSNNQQSYSQFNCYVRAVNEGVSQLAQKCNFTSNTMVDGICNISIQASAKDQFSSMNTFFNCSDIWVNYTIKSNTDGTIGPLNGTLLFIIDNSGLFPNTTAPQQQINLILSHGLVANVNEQEKAKLYLFSGLAGILIIIMIIIAIALNVKIRKLDKQLSLNDRSKSD